MKTFTNSPVTGRANATTVNCGSYNTPLQRQTITNRRLTSQHNLQCSITNSLQCTEKQAQVQTMQNFSREALQRKSTALQMDKTPASSTTQLNAYQENNAVKQLTRTETYKKRRAKRQIIRRHLGRAKRRSNASEVSVVIFHNGRAVKSFPHIPAGSRMGDPETELQYTRSGNRTSGYSSRDGEIFMIDKIDRFLRQYVPTIVDYKTENKQWQTLTGFRSQQDPIHNIKIEVVGPIGTCTDCQAALRNYKRTLNGRFPTTETGIPISFSIVARYFNDRFYGRNTVWGQRSNSTREQSGTYGSRRAVYKEQLAQRDLNEDLHHHKLKL